MKKQRPPGEVSGKKTWKRRLGRVLRWLGVFVAAILLLVVVLPTLLTLLPLESIAEKQINKRIDGTVIIEDVTIGWIRNVSLGRLEVYTGTPSEENLLFRMEKFTAGAGLLKLALSGDRVAAVSIAKIEAAVSRNADGEFNFATLMPLATGEPEPVPEPEEPAEPFKLELDKILPSIPLPIGSLGFRIDNIVLRYDDAALDPEAHIAFNDGSTILAWPGGNASLKGNFSGKLEGNGRSFSFTKDLLLEDWIQDGVTHFDGATLTVSSDVTGPDQTGWKTNTTLRIASPRIDFDSRLEIGQFVELATVYMNPDDLPGVDGTLAVALSADFSNSRSMIAGLKVGTEDVAVDGLAIPALSLEAGAALDKETFDRDDVHLLFDSSLIHAKVTENKSDGADRRATVSIGILPQNTALLADRFLPMDLPILYGRLDLNAAVVHNDSLLKSGDVEIIWAGDEVTIPSSLTIPGTVQPTGDALDMKPTSFRIASESALVGAGSKTTIAVENVMLNLNAVTDFTSPTLLAVQSDSTLDLKVLNDWIYKNFNGLPEQHTSGTLALDFIAGLDGTHAKTSGTMELQSFGVASPLLPTGTMQDSPVATWNLETDLGSNPSLVGMAKIVTQYLDLDFGASGLSASGGQGTASGTIHLEPIFTDFVLPFMPDPPVDLSGGIDYAIDVGLQSAERFDIRVAANPNGLFSANSTQFPIAVNAFRFLVDTSIAMTSDGVGVEIATLEFDLQDFFTSAIHGWYRMEGVEQSTNMTLVTRTDIPATLGWTAETIEQFYPYGMDIAGTVKTETTVDAAFATSGTTMVLAHPIIVSNRTSIVVDGGAVETETELAEFEGILDDRTTRFTLSSMEPLKYEVTDKGTFSIGYLGYGSLFQMEGLEAESEFTYRDDTTFDFSIPSFAIASIASASPSYSLSVPPIQSNTKISGNLTAQTYQVKNLDLSSDDLFEWTGVYTADLAEETVGVETRFALLGLEALGLTLMDETGNPLPISMDAAGTVGANVSLDYATGEETTTIEELNADTSLTDLAWSAGYEEMALSGTGGGAFSYKHSTGTGSATLDAGVSILSYPDVKSLENATIDSSFRASMDGAGTFRVESFGIASEQLGIDLYSSAAFRALRDRIAAFPADASNEEMVKYVFDTPFEFGFSYAQNLGALKALTPLETLDGSIESSMGVVNTPAEAFEVDVRQEAEGINIAMKDLFAMNGLQGRLPRLFSFRARGVPPRQGPAEGGRYFLQSLQLFFPAFSAEIARLELLMDEIAGGYRFVSQSEDFFGGPGNFIFRLEKRGEDPYFYGEFSVTGLDVAKFLPNLERRRVANRQVKCFGSASIRLPNGATVNRLAESLSMRVEVTELGVEILREALRMANADGSNPGIQATLASLRVGRPKSAVMEIRNGLMNMSVVLTTTGGIDFTVPIFEKVGILGFVSPYATPEMDASIRVAREFLLLSMTSDMNTLIDTLSAE